MNSICVFCGSSDQSRPVYTKVAQALGRNMAARGLTLVYGGGGTGLMGAVATGALEAGGQVIGVLPRFFYQPHLAQSNLTRLEIVENMHQRKARMAELAEAFVALPGGFGTLEEFFEVLTWSQIGLHQKPIGLLDTESYFGPLLQMIEHANREGFIHREHRELITVSKDPDRLLDALAEFRRPTGLQKWVKPD